VLNTPYILSRTGHDESALGVILSLTNIGAIVGGIIIGIWGGTRPRTYTIIPGIGFSGLMMVVVGMGQSVPAIAIPFFLLMLPMPMVNTLFMSMIQAKVAPDIQGRVFAVISQVSVLLTPLAYLVAGPLADNVFEASVGTTGWEIFAPVLGNSAGAGIGLMIVVCGTAVVFTSIMAFMTPNVRNLESLWPDYVIETEPLPESLLVDAV
jgi:DHA3 family macrolide efflux protein-like MFS transporter